jgi:hypothetical protein
LQKNSKRGARKMAEGKRKERKKRGREENKVRKEN